MLATCSKASAVAGLSLSARTLTALSKYSLELLTVAAFEPC